MFLFAFIFLVIPFTIIRFNFFLIPTRWHFFWAFCLHKFYPQLFFVLSLVFDDFLYTCTVCVMKTLEIAGFYVHFTRNKAWYVNFHEEEYNNDMSREVRDREGEYEK